MNTNVGVISRLLKVEVTNQAASHVRQTDCWGSRQPQEYAECWRTTPAQEDLGHKRGAPRPHRLGPEQLHREHHGHQTTSTVTPHPSKGAGTGRGRQDPGPGHLKVTTHSDSCLLPSIDDILLSQRMYLLQLRWLKSFKEPVDLLKLVVITPGNSRYQRFNRIIQHSRYGC